MYSLELDKDTMRLNRTAGISNNILFPVCIFLTSQKLGVHSHEGSMSNMSTNTDIQLDIRGNLGMCCVLVE